MDRVCRLACACARCALDASPLPPGKEAGVFFGSGYGTYPSNLDHLDLLLTKEPASPAVFSWTQPNIPAAFISIAFGLGGQILTRSDGVLGGSKAVESALDFLAAGMAPELLAGSASTVDPRVLTGLQEAAGGKFAPPSGEAGGFLLLSAGEASEADPFLAGVHSRLQGEGSDRTEGMQESDWPAPDLLITARPGMAKPGTLPPGTGHVDLGALAGDLMEAAGPVGLSLAHAALKGLPIPGREAGSVPERVWVADADLCGRETIIFRMEAGRGD
jgi:hypothetical protein